MRSKHVNGMRRLVTELIKPFTYSLFVPLSSNSVDDPLKRGQRQVETAKARMGMQIDDTHFRNLLLETQVLGSKDHTRWDLDTPHRVARRTPLEPPKARRGDAGLEVHEKVAQFLSPVQLSLLGGEEVSSCQYFSLSAFEGLRLTELDQSAIRSIYSTRLQCHHEPPCESRWYPLLDRGQAPSPNRRLPCPT